MVFIRGIEDTGKGRDDKQGKSGFLRVSIKEMRVAWVVLSVLVLIFLYSRKTGEPAEEQ